MRAAILLAFAVVLPGCANLREPLGLHEGDRAPRDFVLADEASVAPDHHREHAVPVEAGADVLRVTLRLSSPPAASGLADLAPARVEARLVSPADETLARAVVDPTSREAVAVAQAPAAGAWRVVVDGAGPAGAATYSLLVEVPY